MASAADTPTSLLATVAQQIGVQVDEFVSTLLLIATGLAAVGLFAKVVVDLLKQSLEPRIYFNRAFVRDHMQESLGEKLDDPVEYTSHLDAAEDRLLQLTTAGNLDLLFRMPVEELIAQIKIVTNIALSWPGDSAGFHQSNRSVLLAFTKGLTESELDRFEKSQPKDPIRTYVSSIVDSNLSSLQLRIDYWWRLSMKVLSVIISIALIMMLGGMTLEGLAFATLAGLFAPFAHDFVGGLTKVKNRG